MKAKNIRDLPAAAALGDSDGILITQGDKSFWMSLAQFREWAQLASVLDVAGFPVPTAADAGKVPAVNAAGDGYELKNYKSVQVTLSASGWTGSAAPYSQTVTVAGMTADWVPGIPMIAVGSGIAMSAKQAMQEDLACLSQITSAEGVLTIACYEDKPQGDLTIRIPGVMV